VAVLDEKEALKMKCRVDCDEVVENLELEVVKL
jgi:hypothetical protein